MKKYLSILLILTITLGLIACSNKVAAQTETVMITEVNDETSDELQIEALSIKGVEVFIAAGFNEEVANHIMAGFNKIIENDIVSVTDNANIFTAECKDNKGNIYTLKYLEDKEPYTIKQNNRILYNYDEKYEPFFISRDDGSLELIQIPSFIDTDYIENENNKLEFDKVTKEEIRAHIGNDEIIITESDIKVPKYANWKEDFDNLVEFHDLAGKNEQIRNVYDKMLDDFYKEYPNRDRKGYINYSYLPNYGIYYYWVKTVNEKPVIYYIYLIPSHFATNLLRVEYRVSDAKHDVDDLSYIAEFLFKQMCAWSGSVDKVN